jgi:nucleosome binding factor SPN SPT16 subunit
MLTPFCRCFRRYTSSRGERADVIFKNIKHAVFQPCETATEGTAALHFRLKNAIIVNKKKTEDVQFFTVGVNTEDLSQSRSRMHDRDELEEEQREREFRNKLNEVFHSFVRKAEEQCDRRFRFEIPVTKLGFTGQVTRGSAFFTPTTSCLVSLAIPPFVLTLDDVEFAALERIMFGLKAFDLVFIPKDYTKPPVMISSIPSKSLDMVKEWLETMGIAYMQGTQSLKWNMIMKQAMENPDEFYEEGGWNSINPDAEAFEQEEQAAESGEVVTAVDEDAEEEEEDSDEEFEMDSDDDEEEEEDESDEEFESDEDDSDDDDDDDEDGEGEDEEEGLTWEELEDQARREDEHAARERESRKRGGDSDDEEGGRKRKKSGVAATAAPSRGSSSSKAPPPKRR